MTLPTTSDALSALLSDLDVGSDVFSRPKTLQGMKTRTAVECDTERSQQSSTTSATPPSAPHTALDTPAPPPPQGQPSSDEHSIEHLERMMRSPGAIISTPEDASWPFSQNNPPLPDHAKVATSRHQPFFDDPFAEFHEPRTTTQRPFDEDPLDMFGGTPAPPNHSTRHHPAVLLSTPFSQRSVQGGSNPGFHGGESSADLLGHVPSSSAPQEDDTLGFSDASVESGYRDAFLAATGEQPSTAFAPPPPPQSQSPAAAAKERPPRTQGVSSHRAFQYLDAEEDAAGRRPHDRLSPDQGQFNGAESSSSLPNEDVRPRRRLGTNSLDENTGRIFTSPLGHAAGHHGLPAPGAAVDSVAEVGQRAAKAFQAGTKWFVRASKQLAKDVQSRMDKHRRDGSQGSGCDGGDGGFGSTTVPEFYYDWASQLMRMSPGTRAAALGAMEETDRMVIQDVMDEAALDEATLQSLQEQQFDEGAPKTRIARGGNTHENFRMADGKMHAFSRPTNPPPSYDEVMATTTTSRQSGSRASSLPLDNSVRRQEPVKSEDLLLHMEGDHVKYHRDEFDAASAAASQTATTASADLLGMEGSSPCGKGPTTDSSAVPLDTSSSSVKESDIDSLFTVPTPASSAAAAAAAAAAGHSAGTSFNPNRGGRQTSSHPTKASVANYWRAPGSTMAPQCPDLVGDLADDLDSSAYATMDTSAFVELYEEKIAGTESTGDEPELRRRARERRIAEKHDRMRRQLAEKREREEAEAAEKAGKVEFRDQLRPKIDAWTTGRRDNIRALLSTLHMVLWEDSGWKQPSIADLVEPGRVKRWYMKANLVVHPDKVKQKGGTLEQVATADMVFDVLKAAWGKFEAQNGL